MTQVSASTRVATVLHQRPSVQSAANGWPGGFSRSIAAARSLCSAAESIATRLCPSSH